MPNSRLPIKISDHVRLIDPKGRRVQKGSGSTAFTYNEARRFLEMLPDR